jgi:uncharacterized membrane protein YqaE (UPF0057 family)
MINLTHDNSTNAIALLLLVNYVLCNGFGFLPAMVHATDWQ